MNFVGALVFAGTVMPAPPLVPEPATKVPAALDEVIAYYGSYALGALLVLIVLWWKSRMSLLLTGAVVLFLIVASGIPALILWLHRRGRGTIPAWLRRWSRGSARSAF